MKHRPFRISAEVRRLLTGTPISIADERRLVEHFGASWQWLFELMREEPLAGVSFFMDEDIDPSEVGVEMKWMTPAEMIEEGTKFYPGIAACPLGHLPIGMCLSGSGDPYFLKMNPDGSCAVVHIPHESVTDDDSIREDEVERVAERLGNFFRFATIEQPRPPQGRRPDELSSLRAVHIALNSALSTRLTVALSPGASSFRRRARIGR